MGSPIKSYHETTVHGFHLFLLIAMFLTMAVPLVAMADEAHKEDSHEKSSHEFHRHHVALLLGNTQSEDSSKGPSIGLDYEYRFNEWLGIGGLVEYAGGDFGHVVLGVPLYIHPYKGWLFNLSLGMEIHKEHKEHDEEKENRDWILRTGVAYQFPVGSKYTIAPGIDVDFSEHEISIAYGFAFGIGF